MKAKRKTISKKVREDVYNKYNGHCAYCGCKLEYKDMQVDHINSVCLSNYHGEEIDNSIDNLMPACRQCNFYKDLNGLEDFRLELKNVLQRTCINTFQARLGIKYGMIEPHEWDGKFYFERIKNEENNLRK